jgi:chromate transporter
VAIFFYELPFPLIVLAAGLIGFVGARARPDVFVTVKGHDASASSAAPPVGALRTVRTLAIGLGLWLGPVFVIMAITGAGSVWSDIATFFSKAAVVTFGGAYSVLAYMAQQAVDVYRWLQPGEMVDGLGLAETTPGPLIQVTQFVGFLGAHRNPGTLPPFLAGTLGAILTTWVTFVPSFLWILAGAPHVERLKDRTSLSGALSTITAAVVGVILNLGIWFGIYTLFSEVAEQQRLGARILVPALSSGDWLGVVIALGAAWALFRWNARILYVIAAAGLIGLLAGVI